MSVWYEVKESESLSLSGDKTSVHILFNTDGVGNHYVEVPVELIMNLLVPTQATPTQTECVHAWVHNTHMGWKYCYKCEERRSLEP